ncbi:MAG: hypothetical protein ABIQ52_05300 [Vicinamibacterales bacterium]
MKSGELLQLLREFYRDKSTLRQRHVAAARLVVDYDFNNAYQYVINREDVHLTWVHDAITDHGGTPEEAPEPQLEAAGKGKGKQAEAQTSVMTVDRDQAQAFVDRWRDRVEHLNHARLRTLLRVILGETLEQKRFFEQALAGRTDLLGRRADGAGTTGVVLPTRWVN